LVELQNEGFVRIYSAPWRWKPMFGKHGVIGTLLTLSRLVRLLAQRNMRRSSLRPALAAAELPAGHRGSPQSPNF
jgi:hypothetical protein